MNLESTDWEYIGYLYENLEVIYKYTRMNKKHIAHDHFSFL